MPNIRLLLSYDGTRYAGWQVQPERLTLQGTLETAIHKLTGESLRVLSAGRTDAGVHALGQVASFHSDFPIPPHKWRPALQSQLPEDIVIRKSDVVTDDFHATFSARSKRYRYVIFNQLVDDPFIGRYSWRISQPLNDELMHQTAQCLVGTHDFRSFESDWPNKASSVRTITHLSVRRCNGWDVLLPRPLSLQKDMQPETSLPDTSPYICLEIEADGFLYNMVRTITGTLVNVGRGTWTSEDVVRILQAQDRSTAGATAPAKGLSMVYVNYGESWPVLDDEPV